jgi:hypothetical protein
MKKNTLNVFYKNTKTLRTKPIKNNSIKKPRKGIYKSVFYFFKRTTISNLKNKNKSCPLIKPRKYKYIQNNKEGFAEHGIFKILLVANVFGIFLRFMLLFFQDFLGFFYINI